MSSVPQQELGSTATFESSGELIPRFVGRYYQCLGWVIVTWMLAGPLLFSVSAVRIDLTFILMFWAGTAIRRCSVAARAWTLAATIFFVPLFLGFYFLGTSEISFGPLMFVPGEPGYHIVGLGVALILVLPAALLLTPPGKRPFIRQLRAEQAVRLDAE